MHRKRYQGSFTVYFVLIVTAALSLFPDSAVGGKAVDWT